MNEEQNYAFSLVKNGNSLFLTGEAGVGKTYLLKQIISWAKKNKKNIGVTASTGTAAILLNGTTIHSFLGIGIGSKSPEKLADHVIKNKKFIYNRLQKLDILIIDEISMISDKLLDLISEFLSIIRNDSRRFGGLQFVLSGDCFQLPPYEDELFFKSKIWSIIDNDIEYINLTQSYRHKDDLDFINILRKLRWGKCDKETVNILNATKNNIFDESIKPTLLYSRNIDVDTINKKEFDKLIESNNLEATSFPLITSSESATNWAKICKIPETCILAPGAQVVLTWNYDLERGLTNGARGVIESINELGIVVKFMNGKLALINYFKVENEDNKNIWIKFMPLRLAYALTINKSQGMTLDCAIIVLDKEGYNGKFGYGRAYTALSRVRNLKCIQIHNASERAFTCHPDVAEFYIKNLQSS